MNNPEMPAAPEAAAPAGWQKIVAKTMDKDPEARYASALAMVA